MLAQILPKTLCKSPVSEPGNVFTTWHVSRWCRANFWPASSFSCSVFRFDSKSFSSLCFASRRLCVCKALYFPIPLHLSSSESQSFQILNDLSSTYIAQQTQDVRAYHESGGRLQRKICFLILQLQSPINFICSRPSWWLVLRSATGICAQKPTIRYELGGGVYWEVVAASFVVQSMYFESWLCFVPMQKVTSLDDRRKVFLISFWCFFGSWNLLCPKAKATKVMTIPRLTLLILETHGSHYLNLPSTKITSACVSFRGIKPSVPLESGVSPYSASITENRCRF